jgi:hypothetical protein
MGSIEGRRYCFRIRAGDCYRLPFVTALGDDAFSHAVPLYRHGQLVSRSYAQEFAGFDCQVEALHGCGGGAGCPMLSCRGQLITRGTDASSSQVPPSSVSEQDRSRGRFDGASGSSSFSRPGHPVCCSQYVRASVCLPGLVPFDGRIDPRSRPWTKDTTKRFDPRRCTACFIRAVCIPLPAVRGSGGGHAQCRKVLAHQYPAQTRVWHRCVMQSYRSISTRVYSIHHSACESVHVHVHVHVHV